MHLVRRYSAYWLTMLTMLIWTWWAYAPGLHGDFLFDDFANLPALGSSGPITHWATFFRYITSGIADPTGRPLTLLSFLIDGRNWPTAAYPFKRTNLLLHLANGALLALLLAELGRRLARTDSRARQQRVKLAAISAAAIWLLHPLLVSTVLYVVQREAMLPMTFVLLGLLMWLRGRDAILHGRLRIGTVWLIGGLVGCTILGVLSKANGALLPLYAVLVEYVVLRRPPSETNGPTEVMSSCCGSVLSREQRIYHRFFLLLAWLPSLLLLAYLVYAGVSAAMHGTGRPWTIGQRLLTEPRVLFNYLDLLWVPRPFTPGLFNDQWGTSHSLWSPPTTSLAMLGVIGLLVVGWRIRHRHPALALAILFFFCAQLIESSTIPLELYFEHRNYIAAMFMFWPLSLWLWEAERDDASVNGRWKLALMVVVVLGLTAMTRARTELWGNTQEQALLWATLNPSSARAQANAANHEMAAGQPQAALTRLKVALHEHPNDPQIALNILSAHCAMGGLTTVDLTLAEHTLTHLTTGQSVIFHWLGNAIEQSAAHSCPGLTSDFIVGMLDAAERNPQLRSVTGRVQDIDHLRGQLALSQQRPETALKWFNRGLALRPSQQMAFEQAAALGSAGYPAQGLQHLAYFMSFQHTTPVVGFGMPTVHQWVLQRQNYWGKELVYLRNTLRADAAKQKPVEP